MKFVSDVRLLVFLLDFLDLTDFRGIDSLSLQDFDSTSLCLVFVTGDDMEGSLHVDGVVEINLICFQFVSFLGTSYTTV